MAKANWVMVLLLVAQLTACAQPNSKAITMMQEENREKDETAIIQLTRQLTELMIKKDTIGINKIVDGGFTLTHITGYVQSKSDWFAEIERESMRYNAYKEVKTLVTINGDKALFVGQNLLDARIGGFSNTWRLQQTMQLEKRGGEWIILHSVATTF